MNTLTLSQTSYSSAFLNSLTPDALRKCVPAAFAGSPHESRSASYRFIPTATVIEAMTLAEFYPAEARQAVRAKSIVHARHLIRFRRRMETVALRECVPEVLLTNSHDGTSAYCLRVGLYRAVCTNGLVVSVGTFPGFRVAHRGDVVGDVVRAALEISERFGVLADVVERLEARRLDYLEQLDFASAALALRFPGRSDHGMEPARLLVPRRAEDAGDDAWHVLNRLQENALRGGILRRSASNRLVRTRAVNAIRDDLRINSGLWDYAQSLVA